MTSRSADASSSAFATSGVSGPRRRRAGRAGGASVLRTNVPCAVAVVRGASLDCAGRGGGGAMLGGRGGARCIGDDSSGGGNVLAMRGPLWTTFVISRAVRLSSGRP